MPESVPFRIPTGRELAEMTPEVLERVFGRMRPKDLPEEQYSQYLDSVSECLRLHAENIITMAEETKRKLHELFEG
jgi:hypothetical protein